MATLVQTTSATTRHPSQSYPIVRPSSSSAQRQQPLYLVSSSPQMYMQQSQQQQPFVAVKHDLPRQTYQTQQQAKHGQIQHQPNRRPVPTSAISYPRKGVQHRSRSEETLREKSHVQSQILQSSSPAEAQSAPRPQSA